MTIQGGRVYETLEIKSKSKPNRIYKELFSSNGRDCVFEYPKLLTAMDFDETDSEVKTTDFIKRAAKSLKETT